MKYESLKYKLLRSFAINKTRLFLLLLMLTLVLVFRFSYNFAGDYSMYYYIISGIAKTNINFLNVSMIVSYNIFIVCLSIELCITYKKISYNLLPRLSSKKIFNNMYGENLILISIYSLFFYLLCSLLVGFQEFNFLTLLLIVLKNIYISTIAITLYEFFKKYYVILMALIIILPIYFNYISLIYITDFNVQLKGVVILLFNIILYSISYFNRRYLYEYKD